MNRNLKISLIGFSCLLPVTVITLLSLKFSDQQIINCQGSSALVPFVNKIAKEYQKIDPTVDITTEIGGSGLGIEHIAKDLTAIGTSSKNPFKQVQENWTHEWKNKKIKTVTIGWESICIVYHPIQDCPILDINQKNISKLYSVFSGFNQSVTYADFLDEGTNNREAKTTKIIPYVRIGGSKTSGTAQAFAEQSGFNSSLTDKQQKDALENGNYGPHIHETDDSNSRAWSVFNQSSRPGAMIYLSSGFVKTNQKLIEKKGYKIATCNKNNYLDDNYQWVRPLNCMFSLENKIYRTKIQNFLNWLFFRSEKTEKISDQYKTDLVAYGAKALNQEELRSMSLDQKDLATLWNPDSSDANLQRTGKDKEIYGALFLPDKQ